MTDAPSPKEHAILDATLELISERGFHGTPMSAIAERAGVGAGTIYRYYESKEHLVGALYAREKGLLCEQLLEGCSAEQPARETAERLFRNTVRVHAERSARCRFLEQCTSSPYIGEEARRVGERVLERLVEVVDRGVRTGGLADLPRTVLLALLFGPAGFLALLGSQGTGQGDELVSGTFRAAWHGASRARSRHDQNQGDDALPLLGKKHE